MGCFDGQIRSRREDEEWRPWTREHGYNIPSPNPPPVKAKVPVIKEAKRKIEWGG